MIPFLLSLALTTIDPADQTATPSTELVARVDAASTMLSQATNRNALKRVNGTFVALARDAKVAGNEQLANDCLTVAAFIEIQLSDDSNARFKLRRVVASPATSRIAYQRATEMLQSINSTDRLGSIRYGRPNPLFASTASVNYHPSTYTGSTTVRR